MTTIDITGTVHSVKCWPDVFEAIVDGRKPFDVRQNDRAYAVGDIVTFREWDPEAARFTGRDERAVVTYVYGNGPGVPIALPEGVVVLGLSVGGIEL